MDIKTIIIVSFVTLFMLTISSYTLMKNFPANNSVKNLFVFSLFFFVGQILTGLRNIIPDFLSIIVGNNLLISAHIFLYMAARGLLGLDSKWHHRYFIPIIVVIIGFIFFTYFIYDIQMRIVIFSLFCALYAIIIGWVFWKYSSSQFIKLNRFTAIVFFISVIIFTVRAFKASITQIPANYLSTTDVIIVLPYLYMIVMTTLLVLVFTLQISLSYSNGIDK
ncbi:MAG: hypothetical protein AB1389_07790 [Campylobacterota bacterium]